MALSPMLLPTGQFYVLCHSWHQHSILLVRCHEALSQAGRKDCPTMDYSTPQFRAVEVIAGDERFLQHG
jgi:hypothetical protein